MKEGVGVFVLDDGTVQRWRIYGEPETFPARGGQYRYSRMNGDGDRVYRFESAV